MGCAANLRQMQERCLLLGMGLDEFSMISNEIAAVRYQVRGLAAKQTAELARRALAAGTEKEVRGLLER